MQGSAEGTRGPRCPGGPSGGRAFTRPALRAGSGLGPDRPDSWSGDRPAGPGAAPRAPGRTGGAAYLDGCAGPRARGTGPGGRRGALVCAPVQVGSLGRKWCQPGSSHAARRRGALGARLRIEVRGGLLAGDTPTDVDKDA